MAVPCSKKIALVKMLNKISQRLPTYFKLLLSSEWSFLTLIAHGHVFCCYQKIERNGVTDVESCSVLQSKGQKPTTKPFHNQQHVSVSLLLYLHQYFIPIRGLILGMCDIKWSSLHIWILKKKKKLDITTHKEFYLVFQSRQLRSVSLKLNN